MRFFIEADGGSRGNPGIAGSGTLVLDASGTVLREIVYVVGTASNNVAEYHSLINGLEAVQDIAQQLHLPLRQVEVEVKMDSKLVVEQMSGRWKIKHPDMLQLALRGQQIARNFGRVSYTWVPRTKNKRADALSNEAMDALAGGAPVGFVTGAPGSAASAASGEVPAAPASSPPAATPVAAAAGASLEKTAGGVTRTRLLLVRHGQTEHSAQHLYSGSSNPPLDETGRRQAELVAARLIGVDAVLCSPSARARETAEICAKKLGLGVRSDAGLKELDFGVWEGLSFDEAAERDPELHAKFLSDPTVAPPGGESLNKVHRRVKKTLEGICERYPDQTVLVVTHTAPLKSILRTALDGPTSMYYRLQVDLASLSVAEFYSDGPTCVRLVNDTSHLRAN